MLDEFAVAKKGPGMTSPHTHVNIPGDDVMGRKACRPLVYTLCLAVTQSCAGIFKQSMGVRNRIGIGLSYRPARLHSLADLFPWNRFLGSLEV
jgi:hypothetical protein